MLYVVTFLALLGYSTSLEDCENGKVSVRFCTPEIDYIWAFTKEEIYHEGTVYKVPIGP